MNISATPETVRAVTQVFTLAGILDDRVAQPDKARVIAWAEQIERHKLTENDLLDGLQAFYDNPSERAIQIGDLIHHARTVRRVRRGKEADARQLEIQAAGDRKTADAVASVAAAFTPGPTATTPRLEAAETALQCAVDKQTALAAMREFFTARAQARRCSPLTNATRDLVARQRAASPPASLIGGEE